MKPDSILLSGATGFLGGHFAEYFSLKGYKVIALVRNSSDLSACNEFLNDNIIFINTDSANYKELIREHNPKTFIHSAWGGVTAKGRNDWNVQAENILMTIRFLVLAEELKIKKIISFGSQAEYGNFNGRIKEDAVCNPVSAYGAAKLAALDILKSFCDLHSINWFWLRLFSLFGTRENNEWLIPSVINNLIANKPMDMTACEQRYDYLYIKDFCKAIEKVIEIKSESGIFNLGSNTSFQLKEMIEKIKTLVNPKGVLNIGALPYRHNQVMHMEGDSKKFMQQFNFTIASDFDRNLKEVVNYYMNKNKK